MQADGYERTTNYDWPYRTNSVKINDQIFQ